MDPNEFQENYDFTGGEVEIPNPVRKETHEALGQAKETIATTHCSPDSYNSCTEDFEGQREACKQESCDARTKLLGGIGIIGKAGNTAGEMILKLQYGKEFVDRGYSDTHLLGYNNTQGNFAIEIAEFENILQGTPPKDWNSLALVNYFKYLEGRKELDLGTLLEKMGAAQIMALRKLWKEQPNGPAMKYFETDENLKKVLESVQDIDFEALLRDKENLGIFISLFEHADPEEKEKMKEQIVWYFSELFEKNQDISFLMDIAGGDVLEANSSLTTFLKEQARKTLMARKIYDSLSIVYADVGINDTLLAIIKIVLEGRGIDEKGKLTFDFGGMNESIHEYNAKNPENQKSPIGENFSEQLLGFFEHESILQNYISQFEKLESIQQELKRKYEQLEGARKRGHSTQSILADIERLSKLEYSLSLQISDSQRKMEGNLKSLFGEQKNDDEITKILTYSPSEEEIRKNPESTLPFITNKIDLLALFRNSEIQEMVLNLSFSKIIAPHLQKDGEVIISFPGYITADDFPQLGNDNFGDEAVLKAIIQKHLEGKKENWSEIITHLGNKFLSIYPSEQKKFLELLQEIYESEDRDEDEKKVIIEAIPLNMKRAVGILPESEFKDALGVLGVLPEKKDIAYYEALLAENEETGSSQYSEKLDAIVQDIDKNIETHGVNASEDLVLFLIEKGLLHKTNYTRHNLGKSPTIWGAILDGKNISDIRFLDEGTRKDEVFLSELIRRGIKNASDYYAVEVFLVFKDTASILTFLGKVDTKIPNIDKKTLLTRNKYLSYIRNDVSQNGFEGLTEEQKQEVLEVLLESGKFLAGIQETLVKNQEHIQPLIGSEVYATALTSLFGEFEISERQQETLRNIIETADGSPVYLLENGPKLLEILGTEERVNLFLQKIGKIEAKKAEAIEDNAALIPRDTTRYNEETRGRFFDEKEGKFYFSEEKIHNFYTWFRANNPDITRENFQAQLQKSLIDKYGLSQEHSNIVYQEFFKGYIHASEQGDITNPDGTIDTKIITLATSGGDVKQYFETKFQERNKSYQALYAGSTFDASGNIIPVVQMSENFTAQNPEFITFRREIGTQMGLSLYESDSLSPEEVQILGSSEVARERFMRLRDGFYQANMQNLFPLRERIMQSIGNVFGMAFTLEESDYLSKNEMMILLGEITYAALGEKAQEARQSKASLEQTINIIGGLNNESSSLFAAQRKDIDRMGNSLIERSFLEKFTRFNQGDRGHFNQVAFEEALRA